MKSVRIVSDGTPNSTKVFDAKTGVELTGITRVEFFIDVTDSIARARIEFIAPTCEIKKAEVKE